MMLTTYLATKTAPRHTPCRELSLRDAASPAPLWRRGVSAHLARSLSSCPPLAPRQPVRANQSLSALWQLTGCSTRHARRRGGRRRARSHTTQVAFTQTPDRPVGEPARRGRPPPSHPRHLQYQKHGSLGPSPFFLLLLPLKKMFPRKSVFNLWAIYNGNRPYKMYTSVQGHGRGREGGRRASR